MSLMTQSTLESPDRPDRIRAALLMFVGSFLSGAYVEKLWTGSLGLLGAAMGTICGAISVFLFLGVPKLRLHVLWAVLAASLFSAVGTYILYWVLSQMLD